jgi:hypothetical protein
LSAKVAIIHPRLRVRIFPLDSKVESSNISALLQCVNQREAGSRAQTGIARYAQRRRVAGSLNRGPLFVLFGTTVLL